ncbi:MAG: methyltransferase domain-containing protein, partial [Thermoguttaceae bacterium]|nr:methyltransferase domain-containing protein [Thermoguttaceae bacterium]
MGFVKNWMRRLALAVLPTRIVNRIRMRRNARRPVRRLEIGPGETPLPGYETLDIIPAPWVDYVLDATKPLPFPDASFQEVYASHILEHVPWYQVEGVLREWVRILSPGGWLKLIVPDGLKICYTLVQYELHAEDPSCLDG